MVKQAKRPAREVIQEKATNIEFRTPAEVIKALSVTDHGVLKDCQYFFFPSQKRVALTFVQHSLHFVTSSLSSMMKMQSHRLTPDSYLPER
jgi:hypothetical protein